MSRSKKDGGIGFRNLQLFNIALLARQGWRLLQNPNSLVFRILKAKYFPTQSFLEASVRGNASYLWRSICEAKESLKLGLCWRVGNGAHIKIWKDAWFLTNSYARVLSSVQVLDEDATVENLIDPVCMCWKEELIDKIFMANEAQAIKQIPLSLRRPPDSRVWIGTRKGNFTVKSAYWFLADQQHHQQVQTSSSSNGVINVFWNRVWDAKVPPKVKLFIWRACRNILPTLTKLFERKASSSFSCSWCNEAPETNDHVLWRCDFAQKVWRACLVQLPSSCDASLPSWDFISICLCELSSPELEIVFVTMWSLWIARNNLIWNAKVPNVDDICHRAGGLALDFLEHCKLEF